MRKIIAFGIAAVLMLGAIVAWASGGTHLGSRAGASAGSAAPIDPSDIMKTVQDLPAQQYDMH